ncbi:phosphomannomutase/phosphoglucomutase [candidate division KSB1 bacterium]|nr:phosphomannomutase/phosphoglucomutase [candidate division KSB1 bacterium]
MNSGIFREYDIRGVVETDLTDDVVSALGKSFGTLIREKGYRSVACGYDLRLSSAHLHSVFIKALCRTGCNVIDVGEVPTPALYYAVIHFETDAGVMITGSHNPIEFNGFKMLDRQGSIFGQQIQKMLQIIEKRSFIQGEEGAIEIRAILPDYLRMLKSKFRFKRPLRVVIDAGNATAGPIAPDLWRELGMDVVSLYCEPDGSFPHHLPDPTVPAFMHDLQERVVQEGADLGLGYDGDADRVGAVDERGRLIFADTLLALFSRDVLQRKPRSPIIFDVKCSQALPVVIEQAGGIPVMWKTGHSLLKAKMKELGAPFAGEMSGHLFFADDYYGFDDGIYASGRLMEIIAAADQPFSALVDQIPRFESTPEIRVECADSEKFAVMDALTKEFADYETNTLDGVRVQFENGWGLVRASNTQPVLVLRFEAETRKELQRIMRLFEDKLDRFAAVKVDKKDFKI